MVTITYINLSTCEVINIKYFYVTLFCYPKIAINCILECLLNYNNIVILLNSSLMWNWLKCSHLYWIQQLMCQSTINLFLCISVGIVNKIWGFFNLNNFSIIHFHPISSNPTWLTKKTSCIWIDNKFHNLAE